MSRDDLRTHPKANELLRDEELRPDAEPEPEPERRVAAPVSTRRSVKTILLWMGAFLLAGVIAAALLFERTDVAIIGGLVLVAMFLLFSTPMILARLTKVAQDEQTREERGGGDRTGRRP